MLVEPRAAAPRGGVDAMKIRCNRWAAWLRYAVGMAGLVLLLGPAASAFAQDQAQPGTAETPPHQVELLLDLLRDPAVQQWLEQQPTIGASAGAQAPAAPQEQTAGSYFSQRLEYLRNNLQLLAAARHKLPAELERARIILSLEFQEHGLLALLFLIAIFVGVGFLCVWGYWKLTTGFRNWIIGT